MKLCTLFCLTAAALAQPNAPAPLTRLEANIQRITKSVAANWGIYIKCLETGEEIALNADQQMDTMSVIRIPPFFCAAIEAGIRVATATYKGRTIERKRA